MAIILGKSVVRGLYDEPINKDYQKLVVDGMPIKSLYWRICHGRYP